MEITPVIETHGDMQIGGGAGWVAAQVKDGIEDARVALELVQRDWNNPQVGGEHPREAAIAAAREAVAHLTEALGVEAPQEAIEETRQALEELGTAVRVLERMQGPPPFIPVQKPTGHFEGAIAMLEQVEHRLRNATVGFG